MITNKELFLQKVDKTIEDYHRIITQRLYTKRLRTKKKVEIFSKSSPLCDDINGTKACERSKHGCFFWEKQQGCSLSLTAVNGEARMYPSQLIIRLSFWREVQRQLQQYPTWCFLKKNRKYLYTLINRIDEKILKQYTQ